MDVGDAARWLLLIHRIPPKPAYLRVKIGRRLQALGAVAIKNSVYALPASAESLEDFQWIRGEIASEGGEAFVCRADFVGGLTDAAVEELFNRPRSADYEELAAEIRRIQVDETPTRDRSRKSRDQALAALGRVRQRLDEVTALDFFGAPGRETAARLLEDATAALEGGGPDPAQGTSAKDAVRSRSWVTRTGVGVDRIASAWLIRRFVDPEARFRFVDDASDRVEPDELRFDMFEAEFTHEGERCTFEVLVQRFALDDPALGQIGEIVHDVDLKDARFARPEAAGLERLIAGIRLRYDDDDERLRVGSAIFESFYEVFSR